MGSGAQLAALSLQGQPDPHRFVAEFAGDDRSVADYLVGEVLDRQPEELRRFLLQTCIVDELSGDLADALTGGHDGEWTLAPGAGERLRGRAGAAARTYRYHQLFAGLLRCELRRQAPEQVAGLHRRAARWYAAHGLVADAIRHALAAGEWRDAADLMAEHGLPHPARCRRAPRRAAGTAPGRGRQGRPGARPAGRRRRDRPRRPRDGRRAPAAGPAAGAAAGGPARPLRVAARHLQDRPGLADQ